MTKWNYRLKILTLVDIKYPKSAPDYGGDFCSETKHGKLKQSLGNKSY
jgi:hypothetical protein